MCMCGDGFMTWPIPYHYRLAGLLKRNELREMNGVLVATKTAVRQEWSKAPLSGSSTCWQLSVLYLPISQSLFKPSQLSVVLLCMCMYLFYLFFSVGPFYFF